MFTVTGLTPDNLGYQITVGGDASTVGVVSGARNVVGLLVSNSGTPVRATPTSAAVRLDLDDPATVLAGLYMLTTVTDVTGDGIPDVFDATDEDGNPPPDDAVY